MSPFWETILFAVIVVVFYKESEWVWLILVLLAGPLVARDPILSHLVGFVHVCVCVHCGICYIFHSPEPC